MLIRFALSPWTCDAASRPPPPAAGYRASRVPGLPVASAPSSEQSSYGELEPEGPGETRAASGGSILVWPGALTADAKAGEIRGRLIARFRRQLGASSVPGARGRTGAAVRGCWPARPPLKPRGAAGARLAARRAARVPAGWHEGCHLRAGRAVPVAPGGGAGPAEPRCATRPAPCSGTPYRRVRLVPCLPAECGRYLPSRVLRAFRSPALEPRPARVGPSRLAPAAGAPRGVPRPGSVRRRQSR